MARFSIYGTLIFISIFDFDSNNTPCNGIVYVDYWTPFWLFTLMVFGQFFCNTDEFFLHLTFIFQHIYFRKKKSIVVNYVINVVDKFCVYVKWPNLQLQIVIWQEKMWPSMIFQKWLFCTFVLSLKNSKIKILFCQTLQPECTGMYLSYLRS